MSQSPVRNVLLLALPLAACGGVPVLEGTWVGSNVVFESDGCAFEVAYGVDADWTEDYTLAHGDDKGTFSLTDSQGDVVNCTVGTDPAFSCTGTVVTDYNEGVQELPPLDAVITIDSEIEGEFVGDSAATASTIFTGSCEGDACDALLGSVEVDIPNPCTSVGDFELDFVE